MDIKIVRQHTDQFKNSRFYEMSTDDYFAYMSIPTLDMVFIDADHKFESALRDFDNVFPHVRNDGFIFLHDTYPHDEKWLAPQYCNDCYKTAEYIRENYSDKCEIITIPVHPGLSIVRKCEKQLEWM